MGVLQPPYSKGAGQLTRKRSHPKCGHVQQSSALLPEALEGEMATTEAWHKANLTNGEVADLSNS